MIVAESVDHDGEVTLAELGTAFGIAEFGGAEELEEVIAAIRSVHSGDAVIAPSTTRRMLDHLSRGAPRPRDDHAVAALTGREREVLVEIARGVREPRDRPAALPVRGNRQDARGTHLGQARAARPRLSAAREN